MNLLTHTGSWELRHLKNYLPKWQWKDKLVDSSHTYLIKTISMNDNIYYYKMNLIGIHQIIYLKLHHWRRSTGKVQIYIGTLTSLKAEFHLHLQMFSIWNTSPSPVRYGKVLIQRLNAWEAEEHKMMVEDTTCTCAQYLSTSRGTYTNERSEERRWCK